MLSLNNSEYVPQLESCGLQMQKLGRREGGVPFEVQVELSGKYTIYT